MSVLEKIAKDNPSKSISGRKYAPLPPRSTPATTNNNRTTQNAAPPQRPAPAPAKGATSSKSAPAASPSSRVAVATEKARAGVSAGVDAAKGKGWQKIDDVAYNAYMSKFNTNKGSAKPTNAPPKMSAGKRFSQRLNPAQRTYFNKLYKSDRTKFRSEVARFNKSKGKFSMGQIAAQPASKMSGAQMVQRYYLRPNFTPMKRPQTYYPRQDFTPMTKPQTPMTKPQTPKPAPEAAGAAFGLPSAFYKKLSSFFYGG